MKSISLRMDDELWARIDGQRGTTPRERWVREAVELRLETAERPVEMAKGVRPPIPEGGPGPSQATVDITPVAKPKRKKKELDPVNVPVGLGPAFDHAFKPRPSNALKCFVCGGAPH
jgi:hypothetical protein